MPRKYLIVWSFQKHLSWWSVRCSVPVSRGLYHGRSLPTAEPPSRPATRSFFLFCSVSNARSSLESNEGFLACCGWEKSFYPRIQQVEVKSWFIWKDPDGGKDWRQEDKGMTEDEMTGWHYWLDGQEFEQALGVGWTCAACWPLLRMPCSISPWCWRCHSGPPAAPAPAAARVHSGLGWGSGGHRPGCAGSGSPSPRLWEKGSWRSLDTPVRPSSLPCILSSTWKSFSVFPEPEPAAS